MHKTGVFEEIQRVLRLESQTIHDCAERWKIPEVRKQIEHTIDLFQKALDRGGKIVVTGVGKSGKIGQKIAATLSSTGNLAVFLHPTEGLHGDLGIVQPQDVIFALSYTGNTEELIRLIPSFKKIKVPVVGLGGNSKSKLAEQCDAWLDASVANEACPNNLVPTTSTTLALAIGDAIAITLMQLRGFDSNLFAKNHPDGSIGKKLSLTVNDVMHSGNQVGVLMADATVNDILVTATEKKLGGVLIVDAKQKLIGLITDGDIRRSLSHREKFFSLTAKDIMTQNPIVAHPEQMAKDALSLMEDRPSQISVLPVVDQQGHWKGLLRLHDLIQEF